MYDVRKLTFTIYHIPHSIPKKKKEIGSCQAIQFQKKFPARSFFLLFLSLLIIDPRALESLQNVEHKFEQSTNKNKNNKMIFFSRPSFTNRKCGTISVFSALTVKKDERILGKRQKLIFADAAEKKTNRETTIIIVQRGNGTPSYCTWIA